MSEKNPFADFDFENLQVGEQPKPLNAPSVLNAPPAPVERPKRGRKAKAPAAEKIRRTRGPRRQPAVPITGGAMAEAAEGTRVAVRAAVHGVIAGLRKPRSDKHTADKRLVKLDLATALQITSTLKDSDGAAFTKMAFALGGLNKASRDRILAALGKVFA